MAAVIYAGTYPVAGVVNVDQTLNQRSMLGFLLHMEDALRGDDFEPFRLSIGVVAERTDLCSFEAAQMGQNGSKKRLELSKPASGEQSGLRGLN